LTSKPILETPLIQEIKNISSGALVSFSGLVRDTNQGKIVTSLEYQIYHELALKEGKKIIHEAKEKFAIDKLIAIHREGHLQLGDIAIWIGVTAKHRDAAYKASRYIIDEIKHRLPIWKKEHYQNEKPEWVYCKDHHHHVHLCASEYYQKQKTVLDPQLLKNKKVLIVGAGGLGCPVVTNLASAGVGEINLCDHDVIAASNLHRQPIYCVNDIGEQKVDIAVKKMQLLNPFIKINAMNEKLNAENIQEMIFGKDLIIDCTDNLKTKYLIHDNCFKFKIPFVSASLHKTQARVRTFDPKQRYGCLRCFNTEAQKDIYIGNCNDNGVLGAHVALIGSIQTAEALAYLEKQDNRTLKETLLFNAQNLESLFIKNKHHQDCLSCKGEFVGESDEHKDPLYFDMTFFDELHCHLIDVTDKNAADVLNELHPTKKNILTCKNGITSKRFARLVPCTFCVASATQKVHGTL
jgi:adenylyltransferase/sulfurtransferase